VGSVFHPPFQGHRFPLLAFRLSLVDPAPLPHLPCIYRARSNRSRVPAPVRISAFTRLSSTRHLTVVAPSPSRQRTNNHAFFVEDVEAPPLHRVAMVVAGHRSPSANAFLRLQIDSLLHGRDELRGIGLEPRFHHSPCLLKPQ
jgi:hypothetical protein